MWGGLHVFTVFYLPCNSSTKLMFELCLSQVSSVFLKPGEGTPLSVVMNWVQDREAAWGAAGTRCCHESFPAAGPGAMSIPLHMHLAAPTAQQEGGSGLKPHRNTFFQNKNVQFQQLIFLILISEKSPNKQTPWQHETAEVNEREESLPGFVNVLFLRWNCTVLPSVQTNMKSLQLK